MGVFLIPLALLNLLCGFFGWLIAWRREAETQGLILGLFLGPFGVIAACLLDGRGRCVECREPLGHGAKICGHCGAKYARPFGSATTQL